jgi:hypothetical protein
VIGPACAQLAPVLTGFFCFLQNIIVVSLFFPIYLASITIRRPHHSLLHPLDALGESHA